MVGKEVALTETNSHVQKAEVYCNTHEILKGYHKDNKPEDNDRKHNENSKDVC